MGLYSTPAVRQAVLRIAWYIRPIRLEIRFERKKTIRRSLLQTGPDSVARLAPSAVA